MLHSSRLHSLLFLALHSLAFSSSAAAQSSALIPASTDAPSAVASSLSEAVQTSASVSDSTPSSLPTSFSTPPVASSSTPSESPSSIPTASPSSEESTSAPTSSSSSDVPEPSSTDVPSSEFDIIRARRLERIVQSTPKGSSVEKWLDSQQEDGTWSDVNYATGCAAQRANWPAQEHWVRIQSFAAAWHGGLTNASSSLAGDPAVQDAISRGMDWWFDRDFTNEGCLYDGGTDACPCDDADEHMWNTNWFANVIGIPEFVGKVCLLMGNETLSATQASNCTNMPSRAYASIGTLTGANVLDVAALGIDMALESRNESVILDAYERVHKEMLIVNKTSADGTRPDGSFGQHIGLIYNGNYGKDYVNAILDLETQAADTSLSATQEVRDAFSSLIDGDKWMVFLNTLTRTPHWDFSVLPRFISFPVIDNQATANLKINLTEVKELGQQWESDILTSFADTVEPPAGNGANVNGVTGNRMFYANDYMVHRGEKYVTTLKMLSTRAKTSECTNTQNPLGYHLSDGTLYTYVTGDEYEDISAAWDWNIIPGTTTFYGSTPLNCATTAQMGIEPFAGGVSNGNGEIGVAAMKYANPLNKEEKWQKAWFFLQGDVQRIMISNISTPSSNATILSVLDQKKHSGVVYVEAEQWDGVQTLHENGTTTYEGPQALWHAGVGYTIDSDREDVSLIVELGEKKGNWSLIGTSKQPVFTVDLFSASLHHNKIDNAAFAYTAYPGTETVDDFYERKDSTAVETVRNDGDASAVYDWVNGKAMVVFWSPEGGSVDFSLGISLSSSTGSVLVFDTVSGELTVSDPTQQLGKTDVTLKWGKLDKTITFELPTGGEAGKGVSKNAYH